MLRFLLPADFTEEHRQIVLEYTRRGHEFDRKEWRRAITAFDLLKDAVVVLPTGLLPFPIIYRRHVENNYADAFIEQLYTARQVKQESVALWANIAGRIAPDLSRAGLYRPDVPASHLLVSYCLYWWRSFTHGYILEIEIQRDLTEAGIQFEAHNLRQREERLSPYDIAVLGFKGDIKTSLYFLQATRSYALAHDFYITQIRGRKRTRTLVVFMQTAMWDEIDGETLFVLLEKVADTLPQAARIVHEGVELTVIDYDAWKDKVRHCQASRKGGSR